MVSYSAPEHALGKIDFYDFFMKKIEQKNDVFYFYTFSENFSAFGVN